MQPKRKARLILKTKPLVLIILFILIGSCKKELTPVDGRSFTSNARPDCEHCSVLFIGSSYMDYVGNDVIDIFELFANKANKSIFLDRYVRSGQRLHDHIEDQVALDKINSYPWSFIIFQGNSAYISKEEWHPFLIPYLKEFKQIIRSKNKNAQIIYMMPWAYLDGLTFIEGETDDYEAMQNNIYKYVLELVKDLDIATAPAGWAWYTAISDSFDQELYLSDMNHQTVHGAFLTAAVFYSTLYREQAPLINFTRCDSSDQVYLSKLAYLTVNNDIHAWNIY